MISWIGDDWEKAKRHAAESKRPVFLWLHSPT